MQLKYLLKNVASVFLIILLSESLAQQSHHCNRFEIPVRVNGEITCQKCMQCVAGYGLNYNCYSTDVIDGPITINCVPCINNNTFSERTSYEICNNCSECSNNEEEEDSCTPLRNRKCQCILGFYRENGHCSQSCCYCSRNPVNKSDCSRMGEKKRCATNQKDGGCDVSVNTTVAPATTTSPTTSTKSTTKQVDDSTSTNNPTQHANATFTTKVPDAVDDDKLTVKIAIPLTIFAVTVVVAVCFTIWYRKRNARPCCPPAQPLIAVEEHGNDVGCNRMNIIIDGVDENVNNQNPTVVELAGQSKTSVENDQVVELPDNMKLPIDHHTLKVIRANIVQILNNKQPKPLSRDINATCDLLFKHENNFSNSLTTFENVFEHIETKNPDYTWEQFVKVVSHVMSEEVIEKIKNQFS
ncbi:uncharacterized protein LOC130645506 isoform X2 [Hydractinia symbiolongicarpus]|uniref:uncharacterized protein LOC130645506 isoform X2 n=1 Tax=Hydractinia symbiolongicarpus TaxID=13093 RepID=UPI00254FB5E9|nr:uncharacterized protein LOC130645506 isoform X2 [Hydractinia symbiolongicarpus]